MKKVIISVDSKGQFYVVSAPKKIEVVFKEPKKKTLKKRIKTFLYHLRAGV